jgi:5-methyltetrahydrofolate--homocysteine methyltransferase
LSTLCTSRLCRYPGRRTVAGEDLIFNRKPDALSRLIQHFQQSEQQQSARNPEVCPASPSTRGAPALVNPSPAKEGVEQAIDENPRPRPHRREKHRRVQILNTVLLPAMKEVGYKLAAGELILPLCPAIGGSYEKSSLPTWKHSGTQGGG